MSCIPICGRKAVHSARKGPRILARIPLQVTGRERYGRSCSAAQMSCSRSYQMVRYRAIHFLRRDMGTNISIMTHPCQVRRRISFSRGLIEIWVAVSCNPRPWATRQATPIEFQHRFGYGVLCKRSATIKNVCTTPIVPISSISSPINRFERRKKVYAVVSRSAAGMSEKWHANPKIAFSAQ